MLNLIAQAPKATALPGSGQFRGLGPLGLEKNPPADIIFTGIISAIIGFLTVVAALWFTFNVIIAGYGWLSAGGDKQKLAEAQSKLTSSVIGLTVVVVAIFLVRLVTSLLGIGDVLNTSRVLFEHLIPR